MCSKNSEGFLEIGKIDLNGDKKLNLIMNGCFLVILIIGVLTIVFLGLHKSRTVSTLSIVLACLGFIAVHEMTHIIVMKIFSKEKIEYQLKFPTFSVGCKHLFSKSQFIMAAAAPVVILGCVLLILFAVLPSKFNFLLSVLTVLNFAGASGDYMQIYLSIKSPSNSYFQDDSKVTRIFKRNL